MTIQSIITYIYYIVITQQYFFATLQKRCKILLQRCSNGKISAFRNIAIL